MVLYPRAIIIRLSVLDICLRGLEERPVNLTIETEQEDDGRWLAEIPNLPGVMVYGQTREEAVSRVQALAFRVLADRLENGESVPETAALFSVVS